MRNDCSINFHLSKLSIAKFSILYDISLVRDWKRTLELITLGSERYKSTWLWWKFTLIFQLFFLLQNISLGSKIFINAKKKKIKLSANIQFSCSKIFIFPSAITENRFQISPPFHSSRSNCDVTLTGSVVCLWFSWKWWLIHWLIPAESNSLMTIRWLRAEDGSYDYFFSILLKQSLAGVCI